MSVKLRAAIVGCGNIAGGYDEKFPGEGIWTHAKALRNRPEVELVAAFDQNTERLNEFCRFWSVPFAAPSLDALLDQAQPNVISICVPNEAHFSVFKAVLRCRPRAVICEKPLALSLAEAEEMVELSQKHSILLAVNYMRRWDESLRRLGERFWAGEFGSCRSARVYYAKGVYHNASHAINLFLHWFGPVEGMAVRNSRVAGFDFVGDFSLCFRNCPDVVFQNVGGFNFFSIELNFEKGLIRLPDGGSSTEIYLPVRSKMSGEFVLADPEIVPGTVHTALQEVVDNVLDVINGRGSLQMSAADAVETIRVCDNLRALTVEKR